MRSLPKLKPKFFIRVDWDDLMKTERGKGICPLCYDSGWGNYWWNEHRRTRHVQCEQCHRVFLERGLRQHQKFCDAA